LAADGGGTGLRQCTLQGNPQSIQLARQLIGEIVNRARANAANGNGMSGGGQYVTQQLLIPGQKCGLIIGKNGETIKSMQVSLLFSVEEIYSKCLGIDWSQDVADPRESRREYNAKAFAYYWICR
jgi:predicted RNA-binding protein Jag